MTCSEKVNAPLETCGGCDGIEPGTPIEVTNRAGLDAIRYRIGAYPQFRASMLAGLSSARYPALTGLRTRSTDDFSIGLIDAMACVGDVLSFYQERLANESYLCTAKERVSLQEMGKLIGYRLRPGVAAETWLAFALESPKTAPPGLPPEPGAFVTGIPTALTLAAGLKVQSVPGPDEKPQVFETVETITARPEWSALLALADEDVVPAWGALQTWLAGIDTQLRPGDALLFVGHEFEADPASERWDLRILSEVQVDTVAGRTRVSWLSPLGSISPSMQPTVAPSIYALRQRGAVFGHNAPDWPGMTDEYKAAYLGLESRDQLTQDQRKEWPQYTIFGPGSGLGEQINAQVAPMEAANALREGLRADALAVARQGLTSLGSLGASAGTLVEKAASLPGKVGESAVQAMQLVPGAVGQVTERVMEPIRWLVEKAVGDMHSFVTDIGASMSSISGVINAIGVALTPPGAANPFGSAPDSFNAPAWPPLPPASLPALFHGDELDKLKNELDHKLSEIGDEITQLASAGQAVRDANAGLIEAALANVASATYTARMEADLMVSPRLPYASAETVCMAALLASGDAVNAIPDFVVAAALSDPRPAALLLASLAPLGDLADVERNVADLRNALVQDVATLSASLRTILQEPSMVDTIVAGQALGDHLNRATNAGATLLTHTLVRMRAAAASGVRRAHQALQQRTDALQQGVEARQFIGHASDTVSLDRVYPGLLPGGYAVLQSPGYTELYAVTRVAEASRAEFGVAGKSSLLTLRGENMALFANAVRETTVLAQSHKLERARTPIWRSVQGDVIDLTGAIAGLRKGRRVMLQGLDTKSGERVAHQARLVEDAVVFTDRTTLKFTPALAPGIMLRRDSVVLFGNVALATHGETVAQILGLGDASQSFQRFELKRLPLSYRSASNESGADSQLSVRIGDVEWTERPTLFGSSPDERVYSVQTDAQGRDWVVFGDGVRGARLPSGVNNVRASYRQGLGQAGNVSADRLTQLMSRPMGLKSVSNPAPAQGGTDPEPIEQARRSMPLGTRTLGRAVSLQDYEDFALAFTGVAKAQARVLHLSGGDTVAITLAGPGGDAVHVGGTIWQNLWNALKKYGDPHVNIALLAYQASTFRLGLKVRPDPAYAIEPLLVAVESSLRSRFSFDARKLAQPVMQSEVIAAAHSVPGVLAIDLDLLYGGTLPGLQTAVSKQTRLLASPLRVENGVARPAELLTLAPTAFDRLEEMQ